MRALANALFARTPVSFGRAYKIHFHQWIRMSMLQVRKWSLGRKFLLISKCVAYANVSFAFRAPGQASRDE